VTRAPSHAMLHRLLILAAAALFSTGGAAIKSAHLDGWQVAAFRSAWAAIALYLLLPGGRARWSRGAVVVGVVYAGTMILFVTANKLTTAAATIFLQDTAPLWILLMGPRLLHEPVRRRDLVTMAPVALGLACFFVGYGPPAKTAPDPLRGNILAAVSGVFWAGTVVGFRRLGRAGGTGAGASAIVAGNVIACAVCLPFAFPVATGGLHDWLIVSYLGIIQIGLAYVCLVRGLAGVPALEASLLLLAEPVLNPIWTWLVHGERPGAWALAGGAIILAATTVRSAIETRRGAPAQRPT